MSARRAALGRWAEDVASAYLQRRGYVILARRYRVAKGELDVVALDGPTLCFVEVRARCDAHGIDPLATIRRAKRRRLVAAARAYLRACPTPSPSVRFDAVGVTLPDPWAHASGPLPEAAPGILPPAVTASLQPTVTLVRDAFDAFGARHACDLSRT